MAYVTKNNHLGYWGEGSVNWVLKQVGAGVDWWNQQGDSIIEAGTRLNEAYKGIAPTDPTMFGGLVGSGYAARVKSKGLNLRTEPNTSAPVRAVLDQNQMVQVVGNVKGAAWAYVKYPYQGYVSNKNQYLHVLMKQNFPEDESLKDRSPEAINAQRASVKGSVDADGLGKKDEMGIDTKLLVGGLAAGLFLVLITRR